MAHLVEHSAEGIAKCVRHSCIKGFLKTRSAISKAEKLLIILFLLSLPFVNARVRWDGIGYYAYARSLIVDHNLQFKGDWKNPASEPFIVVRGPNGGTLDAHSTKTGHIPNYYSVGPALLWAPFIGAVHATILVLDRAGYSIPADGHGRPYLEAMGLATAFYGFLGLWLSFRVARDFVAEKWALLATVTIWFASSLPPYMYSDPSWAHAQSAFTVALFLWYWHRSRIDRNPTQWMIWGLISGLMCDVYFANGVLLLLPMIDLASATRKRAASTRFVSAAIKRSLLDGMAYAGAFIIACLPTMIVRQIIFGNPLATGAYSSRPWNWTSPRFWSVLASPSHGLFTSTPVVLLSVIGLVLLWRKQPATGARLILIATAFYALIAVDPWWDGTASFGNRFFISLTPVFVVGLAIVFDGFVAIWHNPQIAMRRAVTVSALLIFWNLGLVYQFNDGLLPGVGRVDWQEALYNQFRIVPGDIAHSIEARISPAAWAREIPSAH